jgi:hypothetical protein
VLSALAESLLIPSYLECLIVKEKAHPIWQGRALHFEFQDLRQSGTVMRSFKNSSD